MIFKVEVNNAHLIRLGKSLGYAVDPNNPMALKAFIENWIVQQFKNSITAIIIQEQTELAVNQQLPSTDVTPVP